MKKNSPLVKVLLVSVVVAVLGYIGLDVPREYVEDAVDTQFDTSKEDKGSQANNNQLYEVVSVIDGDTFKVLREGEVYTVRLIGIDTPETKYSERGEECYGDESTIEAMRLLEDKQVTLSSDSTQDEEDKFGRLLVYATMDDGRDFGEVMISGGFAEEFTFINPYQNQQKYKAAEGLAREEGLGLWDECQ